jgi:hypothetical protein
MKVLTGATLTLMVIGTLHAQQPTSDWRLIGGTSDSYVFYDAGGARKLPDGHFEVWLKMLPKKPTDKAADKLTDDEHVKQGVIKMLKGYVPPIGLDQKLTQDQISGAIVLEEVADDAEITPEGRLLLEVDCPGRMSRTLSLHLQKGGKTGTSDKVGEWQHIAPETNINRLHLALCR